MIGLQKKEMVTLIIRYDIGKVGSFMDIVDVYNAEEEMSIV